MNTKALVIIDVQNVFINTQTQSFVQPIERLQCDYDIIIIFRFINTHGSSFEKHLNWKKCYKNSEESSLAFIPSKDSIILEHSNYSCLTKDLKKLLEKKYISHIDLCGFDTDACILKTAFDLFENKISFSILENYTTSTRGSTLDEAAKIILKRNLGKDILK